MSNSDKIVRERALAIASALAHGSNGDRATARRMGPEGAPVFWRMAARFELTPAETPGWRAITKGLALLTPASASQSIHQDKRWFGAVLADGGDPMARLEKPVFSETRLARLLASRGEARRVALERAVRALAHKGITLDVPSLAWAYLNENGQDIARRYYQRLDHSARLIEKETQNV